MRYHPVGGEGGAVDGRDGGAAADCVHRRSGLAVGVQDRAESSAASTAFSEAIRLWRIDEGAKIEAFLASMP